MAEIWIFMTNTIFHFPRTTSCKTPSFKILRDEAALTRLVDIRLHPGCVLETGLTHGHLTPTLPCLLITSNYPHLVRHLTLVEILALLTSLDGTLTRWCTTCDATNLHQMQVRSLQHVTHATARPTTILKAPQPRDSGD